MQAIEHIEDFSPASALDVGCGSGILSLAIAQRFGCSITACDISADSIETTRANAAAAGQTPRIAALQADGFNHPAIARGAPYDLIVMNILAEPLVRLASGAHGHLHHDGLLMISGILRHQSDAVNEAYEAAGFEAHHRLTLGDWAAFMLVKT